MSVHQLFITFAVFKVAPAVRQTQNIAIALCAVINAPAPMADSTLLLVMLPTMIRVLRLHQPCPPQSIPLTRTPLFQAGTTTTPMAKSLTQFLKFLLRLILSFFMRNNNMDRSTLMQMKA